MSVAEQLWLTAQVWLGMAAAAGLLCGGLWLALRPPDGRLLPRRRPWHPVPWGGLEVFCLFFVVEALPAAFQQMLRQVAGPLADGDGLPREMLATAMAFPAQLGLVFFLLWKIRRARPFTLGVHTNRLAGNVALGYLGWLAVVPVVYGVDALTDWCYQQWTGAPPEQHPLTRLVQGGYPALRWTLFWLLAVATQPALEEVLFRGLLQGWLRSRAWGGHLGMFLALLWTALPLMLWLNARIQGQTGPEVAQLKDAPGPFLFVLVLLAGYALLPLAARRLGPPPQPAPAEVPASAGPGPDLLAALGSADPRLRTAWTIYATATLFAVVHPWPTHIPLFPLGLVLGWLAYRTRSLVGPITLHALFNAVACATFALTQ